jgi:hypothetical protein
MNPFDKDADFRVSLLKSNIVSSFPDETVSALDKGVLDEVAVKSKLLTPIEPFHLLQSSIKLK